MNGSQERNNRFKFNLNSLDVLATRSTVEFSSSTRDTKKGRLRVGSQWMVVESNYIRSENYVKTRLRKKGQNPIVIPVFLSRPSSLTPVFASFSLLRYELTGPTLIF